jgi:hypothetical protein
MRLLWTGPEPRPAFVRSTDSIILAAANTRSVSCLGDVSRNCVALAYRGGSGDGLLL